MKRNSSLPSLLQMTERMYPWKDWFTRKDVTLVKGKDYHINTPSMIQQTRNRACSAKFRLAVRINANYKDDIIRVRVVGRLDDIPLKGRKTAPSLLTTFGRIKLGTSFRFVMTGGKVDYVNPVYVKMKVRGIQGNPYNAFYTYKARNKWRTRYVMVKESQRVGVIEKEG